MTTLNQISWNLQEARKSLESNDMAKAMLQLLNSLEDILDHLKKLEEEVDLLQED